MIAFLVVAAIANPKMPIFFTSLLPQFGASFAALALHGAIFAALTLGWLVGVARADAVLRLPRVRRVLDLCTAAVLVGFGLHLAVERR
jgi:threonine/homoserine/homoserine lactone efflux protein